MLRGTVINPWNIPITLFHGILSVPHNIVMDVNNVMCAPKGTRQMTMGMIWTSH